MHTQINITAKSDSGILPQQGNTNTFQKDKSKQEILEHSSLMATMINTHVVNFGAGVRTPLDE
ncbi:MAG: hypothetical protein ACYDA4_16820 [Ignavibacteriaceae bacterium]